MTRWPLWVGGCALLALLLRAPWLTAPLHVDEGGVALVAGALSDDGPFPYGPYWLDRPPLLVLLYRAGLLGGDAGIRVLGMLAAVAVVVAVALLARRVAGPRAGRLAAAIMAVLAGSASLQMVFTTAEALAVVPTTLSMLCVVCALQAPRRAHLLWAGAGLLAVAALLVKQSFGDALLGGGAALAVCAAGRPRATAPLALAYAAGAAVPIVGLELWERLADVGDGTLSYALLGFRIDGLTALAGTQAGLGDRLVRLVLPALGSGLVLLVPWAISGLRSLGRRRESAGDGVRSLGRREAIPVGLAAWLAGGLVGVLGGGSYWPHYLIQLAPVVAVLAAAGLAPARSRPLIATFATLGVLAVGGVVVSIVLQPSYRDRTLPAARFIRVNAHPGDTLDVLYARADLVYDSGLPSPYPYQWSLMLRTIRGAEPRLQRLLASPRRPTWVVQWQSLQAFGLDRNGRTEAALSRYYRPVAKICRRRVFLRREVASTRRLVLPPEDCPRGSRLVGAAPF